MKKGYHPALLLDKKGDIFAIATGSDATTEHECGMTPILRALGGSEPRYATATAQALKRAGGPVVIPSVMEGRELLRDLDRLVFEQGEEKGEPVAALGYTAREKGLRLLQEHELSFNTFSDPKDLAGAWDEYSFGFKVKGAALVTKLKRFHEALQNGNGLFAGLFLADVQKERLGGVIVCDKSKLRPEHKAAQAAAQAKFEANVRLHLVSRVDELHALARKHLPESRRLIGHLSVSGRDESTGALRYHLNPYQPIDQRNFGSHTFDELARWIEAGAKGLIKELAT